jgi:hypothetical protein
MHERMFDVEVLWVVKDGNRGVSVGGGISGAGAI